MSYFLGDLPPNFMLEPGPDTMQALAVPATYHATRR